MIVSPEDGLAFLALMSDLVRGARAIAAVDSTIALIARSSALWRGWFDATDRGTDAPVRGASGKRGVSCGRSRLTAARGADVDPKSRVGDAELCADPLRACVGSLADAVPAFAKSVSAAATQGTTVRAAPLPG